MDVQGHTCVRNTFSIGKFTGIIRDPQELFGCGKPALLD